MSKLALEVSRQVDELRKQSRRNKPKSRRSSVDHEDDGQEYEGIGDTTGEGDLNELTEPFIAPLTDPLADQVAEEAEGAAMDTQTANTSPLTGRKKAAGARKRKGTAKAGKIKAAKKATPKHTKGAKVKSATKGKAKATKRAKGETSGRTLKTYRLKAAIPDNIGKGTTARNILEFIEKQGTVTRAEVGAKFPKVPMPTIGFYLGHKFKDVIAVK